MKFKQWIKEHQFEIFLAGITTISMAALVLIYKKSCSDMDMGDVLWDKGFVRGFNKMCEYLQNNGHQEVLDDLIAKGLVIKKF